MSTPIEIGQLTRLELGYVGETGSRDIQVDMTTWMDRWPEGAIAILARRPDTDNVFYFAVTEVEGSILTWTVTETDVAVAGRGMAQISIYDQDSGAVYKSRTVQTIIKASIDETLDEDAPDPMETWVAHAAVEADRATTARQMAQAARDEAEGAAEDANVYAAEAESYARRAQAARDEAEGGATSASASATQAMAYAMRAESAEASAETSKTSAAASAQDAASSKASAEAHKTAALGGAHRAEAAAAEAQGAVDGFADTVAAAVEEISASKQAAVDAVAAKGDEVLASIPADYTELVAQVDRLDAPVTKERTDFWTCAKSSNLFDANSAIDGYYINAGASGAGSLVANTMSAYAYVRHDGAGTYYTKVNATLFGVTKCLDIALFDARHVYVATVVGIADNPDEAASYQYGMHFELTEDHIAAGVVYIGLTMRKTLKDQIMLVKGDAYPDQYIAYWQEWSLPDLTVLPENAKPLLANPLYGKVAVFDGDSICNGGSAADGLSGWAGRIGAGNAMTWHNYGVGGGTITEIDGHYCIGGNVETIHAAYQKLDYLILEGGTNDADTLGDDGLGTYSPTDYSGSYDMTTFSGALETLLYKAVTMYPRAKIGYIVAHKMGQGGGATRRRTYFDRAVELCTKWGVPYIDLWHEAHLNRALPGHYDASLDAQGNRDAGSLYTDGQHLTSAGYEVITPKIEAWMRTL